MEGGLPQGHQVLSRRVFVAVLLGWLLLAFAPGGVAAGRSALVIGNGAYAVAPLTNPVNDASDIAARLDGFGFAVTLLHDADQRSMEEAIANFTRDLTGRGNVGLFFFAGHAIEYQGRNYLLPVGAEIRSEVDLRYNAVDAGRVIDGMDAAANGLNLVVLDACRNNPYPSGMRSASRGLARMSPARGTLILYATQPGAVARDGGGRNGTFTSHLLAAMDEPGLEVEQVFKRAALAVDRETGGAQTPWVEGVVLGQFRFDEYINSREDGPDAPTADVVGARPDATPRPPAPPAPPSVSVSSAIVAPPPPPAPVGHLQVNVSTPAKLWMDGTFVGNASPGTPLNLSNLSVGEHRLQASATGHLGSDLNVRVYAGQWAQAIVTLVPEAPPPPPPPVAVSPSPAYASTSRSTALGRSNSRDGHIFSSADGPSFRCGGDLRPVESVICGDAALARADGAMGEIYRHLRSLLGSTEATDLRNVQRAWIQERDRACPVSVADLDNSARFALRAACLQAVTEQRASELLARLRDLSGD